MAQHILTGPCGGVALIWLYIIMVLFFPSPALNGSFWLVLLDVKVCDCSAWQVFLSQK